MVAISGYIPEPEVRKIVQILNVGHLSADLVALCNDGTVWALALTDMPRYRAWRQLSSIPQPEAPDARTQT